MSERVVVINNKAGVLSLPYFVKGKAKYQDFMPGKNVLDAEVLEAVKEANEESWDHYSRHLKVRTEAEVAEGGSVNISDLTVNEAKDIISNTMDVKELGDFMAAEEADKNRKGVKDVIEAQIEILEMKKVEDDIINRRITTSTLQRQKQLEVRLLKSKKALHYLCPSVEQSRLQLIITIF